MTGLNCEGCKENFPYAEANQPNGKLICYGCKANGFVYKPDNWIDYANAHVSDFEKYINVELSTQFSKEDYIGYPVPIPGSSVMSNEDIKIMAEILAQGTCARDYVNFCNKWDKNK